MKYQLFYVLIGILSLPFLPILFLMGVVAKKRTGKLPEAFGPSGVVDGSEPVLKLAVIGESTVAGVGVMDNKQGVSASIAGRLSTMTGRSVNWEAIGVSGYTARKVFDNLLEKLKTRISGPDIIVIMLGGNDTFELNSPMRWRRDMGKLITQLRKDHPDAQIVIANLPPVSHFTSFTPILQWFLGGLTNLHRKVIRDFPLLFPGIIYMSEEIDFDKWRQEEGRDVPIEEFFSDGVHPSALTYRLWGKQIAERILQK